MWPFRIWFSRHGGVGWMIGLDDLRGPFQPMILRFSDLSLSFLVYWNKLGGREEEGKRVVTVCCCSRQQKRHVDTAPPTPRPARVRRRMERNRQKLVGQDKGSLTEQQTKGTGTTTIQMRGIHKTNPQNRACRTEPLSRRLLPCAPQTRVSSRHPAPPHQNPA